MASPVVTLKEERYPPDCSYNDFVPDYMSRGSWMNVLLLYLTMTLDKFVADQTGPGEPLPPVI